MKELKILNPSQVYFYIDNGIELKRVECGYKNRLIFVFDKEETREIYGKWIKKAQWKLEEK